jgi:hypothetical protein
LLHKFIYYFPASLLYSLSTDVLPLKKKIATELQDPEGCKIGTGDKVKDKFCAA